MPREWGSPIGTATVAGFAARVAFAMLAVSCGGRANTASPALEAGIADGGSGRPVEGGVEGGEGGGAAEGGDCWSRCTSGMCDGDECIVTLVRGYGIAGMAMDSTNVYFVEALVNGPAEAAVVRVPIAGGSPVTLAQVGHASRGENIAVDAHNLYWTTSLDVPATGTIMQVPIAGGTNVTLATTQDVPGALALAGTSLYATLLGTAAAGWNDGAILQVPIGGGAAATLASGQAKPMPLVTDGSDLYWATQTSVMRLPVAGGMPVTLAPGTAGSWGMAIAGGYIYFEDPQTGQTILRVPSGGGTPSVLTTSVAVSGVAVDGTNLYWVEAGSTTTHAHGAIVRMPLSGGVPVTLTVLDPTQGTSPILVDATSVYWTDSTAVYRATPK